MHINVQSARIALGNLVKAAQSFYGSGAHPLKELGSVSDIKQGRNGWNADRVWPIWDSLSGQLNIERDALIRQALVVENVPSVLDSWSAVDWAVAAVLRCSDNSSSQPSQEVLDEIHLMETVAAADHSDKEVTAAPHISSLSADEVAAGLADKAPQGSDAYLSVAMEALKSSMSAVAEEGNISAKNRELIDQLNAKVEGLRTGAKALNDKITEAREAIPDANDLGVSNGALKGEVAAQIKGLSEDVIKTAIKNAKEIPDVPTLVDYYLAPKWAERIGQFMEAGIPVLVGGSSGAGKTFVLRMICAMRGLPCKTISANENLDAETLISQPKIKGGTSYHADGPLAHAMRHGYGLIVDEGDEIRRGEALVFNFAIEYRKITDPATGEVIEAADGFAIAFTSNSVGDELGLYNREGFDESLLQRCQAAVSHPLSVNEEVTILLKMQSPEGQGLSRAEAESLANWAHATRPLHFGTDGIEPQLARCPSTRILANAVQDWLGFNRETGATFPPLKDTAKDIREALFYAYGSKLSSEEVQCLKANDLKVWA
jgi:hypothetical protein